ncbi:hypothetical protein D3C76_1666540 [compost metagenome]
MGLGFRQFVVAEAQGRVDEEAGQSHVESLQEKMIVVEARGLIAGKPCSHSGFASLWEQGLPAMAVDQAQPGSR